MANGSTNEDAVTEGEPSPVPVELSPEAQAALQEAVDAAAAEAGRQAREEMEPKLRAEQEEKARLEAEAEAARAVAEAEAARLAAEEEAKRLADEEAARLAEEAVRLIEEARKALAVEQTPRALKLLRQRYFRGGFGTGDIDAVLGGMEPEAIIAAKETFNAELENLAAQSKASPVPISPAMEPFVSESKPKRRR